MTIRHPAVAGAFYPADPEVLRAECERLLAEHGLPEPVGRVKAVIAPHAGYIYSGPLAARSLSALADGRPIERIVLLGPAHYVPVSGLAVPEDDAMATPLGTVATDPRGLALASAFTQVGVSGSAHLREHCLEVELPFLQILAPDVPIVPLLVGGAPPRDVAEVLDALWNGDGTRVVVSSDLSHYMTYDTARAFDRNTAEAICALDPAIPTDRACGARAINGLLLAARRHQLVVAQLGLANSGDTAGDRARVVGYGAFALLQE